MSADSTLRFEAEKLLDQFLSSRVGNLVENWRVVDLFVSQNRMVNFIRVLNILTKRHNATNHFIHCYSQAPEINPVIVGLLGYDFRSSIVRGPNQGFELHVTVHIYVDFAGRHLVEYRVAVSCNPENIGLEVSENDALKIQHLEYGDHPSTYELCLANAETVKF